MNRRVILLFLVCYQLLIHDRVQCNWSLSRENSDIDKQLKLMNKPAMKTIVNKYGDTYDCIDINKQLAFDHPLLKNQTFDFQINSVSLLNKTREQDYSEFDVCPIGSIPVRRITKDDLVRERHAYEDRFMDTTNRPDTYLAIARTKRGQGVYTGIEGRISLHNPKVFGNQFSTTRIKLQSGPNSIEVGWRVDPPLYGDYKTRLFVRTDVGRSHCFNTRCPGFVHTNREIPLDYVFDRVSVFGGTTYSIPLRIIRDNKNGNWNFIFGNHNKYVGFWPSQIFHGLANYLEWGGAAYSPLGSPLPHMGSGNLPIGATDYDGFIANMKMVNEKGESIDAKDTELFADDSSLYSVRNADQYDVHWGHLIFYGGSGFNYSKNL